MVQRMLNRDTRTSPLEKTVQPLAGILYCGDCHRASVAAGVSSVGTTPFIIMCVLLISVTTLAAATAFRRKSWKRRYFMLYGSKLQWWWNWTNCSPQLGQAT